MKILGCGYPRTGTLTLTRALTHLGYSARHDFDFDDGAQCGDVPERGFRVPLLPHDTKPVVAGVYDDTDALINIPAVLYWRELADAYPEAKVILTVREPTSWYASNVAHSEYNRRAFATRPGLAALSDVLGALLFGSAIPSPYWWVRRYMEHNRAVLDAFPSERLLVMDITKGDGWRSLCSFLGVPIPDIPWPHENKRVGT